MALKSQFTVSLFFSVGYRRDSPFFINVIIHISIYFNTYKEFQKPYTTR